MSRPRRDGERSIHGAQKVGVVTTSFPRFAGDAAGNFVAGHVTAMRAAGHTVDVIAAGDGRTNNHANPALHRIPSRLFYRGGAPDALEAGNSIGAAVSFAARLCARVVRCSHRWDLIVAHWLAPSALAAVPTRARMLAIAHGGDIHTLARLHLLGPTLALLRARRAKLAFVSADLLALARCHGRVNERDAIIQPMGVDVEHFRALPRRPTARPTVVVLARLVPLKGVDTAIEAMRRVRHDAALVIAGDGPEQATLARAAAGNDRIAFVGAVDAAERDRWLSRASVVVVPSRILPSGRTEGTPLVALEALAAGVPVVASKVGGLQHVAGTIAVPPNDPVALAAAIDRAIEMPCPPHQLRAAAAPYAWHSVAMRLMAHASA